jgi:hypothetical protein
LSRGNLDEFEGKIDFLKMDIDFVMSMCGIVGCGRALA